MSSRNAIGAICLATATILGGLMGCAPLIELRNIAEEVDCNPAHDGTVNVNICAHAMTEKAGNYELHFIEFDDQGWLYDDHQLDFIANLAERAFEIRKNPQLPGLSIVVFVHGWKHNAAVDDSNVQQFRQLLTQFAWVERASTLTADQHDVVGIYLGWRGKSVMFGDPLENVTFWDRKSTAAQVAQGTPREVLARLSTIAEMANDHWLGGCGPMRKPVRSIYIGHSFGGHILLTGLSQVLLRDLVDLQQREVYGWDNSPAIDCTDIPAYARKLPTPERRVERPLRRQGDLVLLLNPAIEATRYDPIHRIANNFHGYKRYRAPMFVSVTSTADDATGVAFPAGRAISTIFESYPSDGFEANADRITFGHDDHYITHALLTLSAYTSLAPDKRAHGDGTWIDVASNGKCNSTVQEVFGHPDIIELKGEIDNHADFVRAVTLEKARPDPRFFCRDIVLKRLQGDVLAPVMNVRTDGEFIPDHNNVFGERFMAFIRQLYLDPLITDFAFQPPRQWGDQAVITQ